MIVNKLKVVIKIIFPLRNHIESEENVAIGHCKNQYSPLFIFTVEQKNKQPLVIFKPNF